VYYRRQVANCTTGPGYFSFSISDVILSIFTLLFIEIPSIKSVIVIVTPTRELRKNCEKKYDCMDVRSEMYRNFLRSLNSLYYHKLSIEIVLLYLFCCYVQYLHIFWAGCGAKGLGLSTLSWGCADS